ncbi:MAG: inner membrane PPF- chloroplastic-like [Trebouxia sp. A1-2]|nr:MAG: inner membrane PPF- chloroplastic-like [Trebouxia sp. A1-2]
MHPVSSLGRQSVALRHVGIRASASPDDAEHSLHSASHSITHALYSLSDTSITATASDATAAAADTAVHTAQRYTGWFSTLADYLEGILGYLQTGLDKLHVPYSYGWSIILLTLLVKTALFPITRKQVESGIAMQNLKPTIDNIKRLYGCLPSLATIPVFIGLYNSLTNVANSGRLDSQGFFWLPSLAGPTSLAARRAGNSTAWLYPFVDGHPPIGWEGAARYLVLPVLLVAAQFASTAIISPPVDPNDENAQRTKNILAFLPLMIGYFALQVPSGLSLYYFSNTVLTSGQQIWLRKLGGASALPYDLGPIDIGKARRTGQSVSTTEDSNSFPRPQGAPGMTQASSSNGATATTATSMEASSRNGPSTSSAAEDEGDEGLEAQSGTALTSAAASMGLPADLSHQVINRRCKRKKRHLLEAAA